MIVPAALMQWLMWGESELGQMVCWGSHGPGFVNNDYVTAEITCSTVHVHHEVPSWSWASLCSTDRQAQPRKVGALQLCHCYITEGKNAACLWVPLLWQPRENTHVCSSYGSESFLSACTFPTLGSLNSAHSEIQQDSRHHEKDQ